MSAKLETRVATLERELASLREKVENPESPWWKQNLGQFANDPIYAEAMKLGRAFREGQRSDGQRKPPSKVTTSVRTLGTASGLLETSASLEFQ